MRSFWIFGFDTDINECRTRVHLIQDDPQSSRTFCGLVAPPPLEESENCGSLEEGVATDHPVCLACLKAAKHHLLNFTSDILVNICVAAALVERKLKELGDAPVATDIRHELQKINAGTKDLLLLKTLVANTARPHVPADPIQQSALREPVKVS